MFAAITARRTLPPAVRAVHDDSAADDAALVLAARKDPHAFGPLYERYVRRVYRYCYLRLGSRQEAEDATSDVFLRAVAGLPDFHGDTFAAWLFRIARNIVVDVLRAKRPSVEITEYYEPRHSGTSTEHAALAAVDRDTLYAAIAQLPDAQRRAIELQLAGWTLAQTASILDVSSGAVKLLRYRAVRRLRQLLIPTNDDSPQEVAHDR